MSRVLFTIALVLFLFQCQCRAKQDTQLTDRPLLNQNQNRRIDIKGKNNLQNQSRVPNEYIVTVITGKGEIEILSAYGHLGIIKLSVLTNDSWLIVFNKDPQLQVLEAIRDKQGSIKAIQPNYIYQAN